MLDLGFFNKYPYTDFHELNLDWLLSKVKQLEKFISQSNYNIKVFDSVLEMQSAEMVPGIYAITLGYYAPNDGGGAYYHIVKEVPAGYYEIAAGPLYCELLLDTDYVNVQQLGAKGDGITDDGPAFSKAFQYYGSVLVPIRNGQIYRIASEVLISKQAFCMFGDTIGKNRYGFSTFGCIYIDRDYAFRTIAGGSIEGLSFCGSTIIPYTNAPRTRNGILLDTDGNGGTDVEVKNCYFTSFNIVLNVQGRGACVHDCQFTWTLTPVAKYYSYNGIDPGQTLTTGDRAFRLINNRFHATDYMLKIYSGYLTGAIISGNVGDVGTGCMRIENDASVVNSIISDNVSTQTDRVFIYMPSTGKFNGNVIKGNTQSAGADKYPANFLNFTAAIDEFVGNVISNNYTDGCKIDPVDIRKQPLNCVFSGNVFRNAVNTPGDIYHAIFRIAGLDQCSIIGNSAEFIGDANSLGFMVGMRSAGNVINGTCIEGNSYNKNGICSTSYVAGSKPNTIQSV